MRDELRGLNVRSLGMEFTRKLNDIDKKLKEAQDGIVQAAKDAAAAAIAAATTTPSSHRDHKRHGLTDSKAYQNLEAFGGGKQQSFRQWRLQVLSIVGSHSPEYRNLMEKVEMETDEVDYDDPKHIGTKEWDALDDDETKRLVGQLH